MTLPRVNQHWPVSKHSWTNSYPSLSSSLSNTSKSAIRFFTRHHLFNFNKWSDLLVRDNFESSTLLLESLDLIYILTIDKSSFATSSSFFEWLPPKLRLAQHCFGWTLWWFSRLYNLPLFECLSSSSTCDSKVNYFQTFHTH